MPRVAIVIVTYNSADEIGDCLNALAGLNDVEILVVDNASSDATRQHVAAHGTPLIANPTNAGFAAAVNQGVLATTAPLLLLLNPDAKLIGGLDALVREFDDPNTGAAGGRLIGLDGQPQTGFMARNLPTPATLIFEILGINRLWPGNPVNWHYRCLSYASSDRSRVEQPAGAFLMFSRKAWQTVGGFDERFHPVWFEDVDFCASLKRFGFSVFFNPAAVANHTGAHSVGLLSLQKKQRYWYGSLLEYAAKYYHSLPYRAVCLATALSAAGRAVLGLMRGRPHVLAVYGNVCRFAIGRFFSRRRSGEISVVSGGVKNS